MRPGKRRGSGGHSSSSERWLVSYADLITLLFALFVILYAMSQSDLAKFKKASQSLKNAFDHKSETTGTSAEEGAVGGKLDPFQVESREFTHMQDELEQSMLTEMGTEKLPENFALLQDERGLIVRIAVKDFFLEGSAAIPDDLKPVLLRIGKTLSRFEDKKIRIEGYTDLAESHPKGYPSGWELSSARAASVARLWVQDLGFDPRRLSVGGYGHYQPLTDKTGEWLRSLNRRIEILVLRSGKPPASRSAPAPH